MSPTLAIAKKEMRGFLVSPQFYMVVFFCSVVFSWVYPIQLSVFNEQLHNAMMMQGQPGQAMNIHYAVFLRQLSYLNLMLIFIVPALTMRLFAEERKLRTFDLLLTCPITSWQIVLGKYLSALGAVGLICLVGFSYPAMTRIFAEFSWLPLIIAFLGIYAVGAVYAAMDLFCSSLTDSAIIAYVMAVIMNVSVWFIGIGAEVVDTPVARQIFEHISLNSHLASLVEGTVRTNSVVFLLSLVVLFAFLSERVIESLRWR